MVSTIITTLVIVLDQISKLICLNTMSVGQSFEIIPGILRFTYVQNKGAAFGMMSHNRWVFMIVSVLVIIAVIFALKFYKANHKLYYVSLALIFGGGIGNMIDRVWLGYVVDFIDFCAFDFWKWVFNIADSAVTVGCILFIVYLLFFDTDIKKQPQISDQSLIESNTTDNDIAEQGSDINE